MTIKQKEVAVENQKPYYDKPGFKLYLGDCLEVLKLFPENSFDMVFADPPYLLSNGGFTVHAGKRVSVNKGDWDKSNGLKKDFEFHLEWIQAVKRVLKSEGTIWISGTYHSIYQCGFALQLAGFHNIHVNFSHIILLLFLFIKRLLNKTYSFCKLTHCISH